jgi:hypothetical protein
MDLVKEELFKTLLLVLYNNKLFVILVRDKEHKLEILAQIVKEMEQFQMKR